MLLGYKWNRASAGVEMTLDKFYNDPTLPTHDPNSRFITPCSPGDPLYDDNFNLYANPVAGILPNGTNRIKLTTKEANQSRLCTKERGKF